MLANLACARKQCGVNGTQKQKQKHAFVKVSLVVDGCRTGGLETAPRLLDGDLGSFHRRSIVLRSFPARNRDRGKVNGRRPTVLAS